MEWYKLTLTFGSEEPLTKVQRDMLQEWLWELPCTGYLTSHVMEKVDLNGIKVEKDHMSRHVLPG
jgi:hypothetical protein